MSDEGKTCADLAGATRLSESTVRKRMKKLERAGLVSRAGVRPSRWKRGPVIYPPDAPSEAADSVPAVESHETVAQQQPDAPPAPVGKPSPRRQGDQFDVLLALIALHNQCESGTATAKEVASEAGLHVRAAQRHLAKLAEAGRVVKIQSRGRGAGWGLPPAPQEVARASFAEQMADPDELEVALGVGKKRDEAAGGGPQAHEGDWSARPPALGLAEPSAQSGTPDDPGPQQGQLPWGPGDTDEETPAAPAA